MTGHDRNPRDDDERMEDVEAGEEKSTSSASRTSAKSESERIRYNPTKTSNT